MLNRLFLVAYQCFKKLHFDNGLASFSEQLELIL